MWPSHQVLPTSSLQDSFLSIRQAEAEVAASGAIRGTKGGRGNQGDCTHAGQPSIPQPQLPLMPHLPPPSQQLHPHPHPTPAHAPASALAPPLVVPAPVSSGTLERVVLVLVLPQPLACLPLPVRLPLPLPLPTLTPTLCPLPWYPGLHECVHMLLRLLWEEGGRQGRGQQSVSNQRAMVCVMRQAGASHQSSLIRKGA